MIKTIIQVVEVGVGLTVALFMGAQFLKVFNAGAFSIFSPVLSYIVYIFGYENTQIVITIFIGILIVMCGRWIYSWASNNGGQTPNNNGN